VFAALLITSAAARAQEPSLVDQATLDQAVAARALQIDADRSAIRRVLQRREVRDLAARAGLDLTRAEKAVATLDADELQQLAEQARVVDGSLAGGQSITLSTTTIIIGLLILILIIVAVN
jgi:hypothetical protein